MNLTKKTKIGECHANRCNKAPELAVDGSWIEQEGGSVLLCSVHAERAEKEYGVDLEAFVALGDEAFVALGDEEGEAGEAGEAGETAEEVVASLREGEELPASLSEGERDKAMRGEMPAPPHDPIKTGVAQLNEADKWHIVNLSTVQKLDDKSVGTKLGIGTKTVTVYLKSLGDAVPHSDLKLTDEAKQLAKEATSDGKENLAELEEFGIDGQEDLDFAAEVLAETKGRWKRLDEEEKKITRPLNTALKAARDLFRKPKKYLVQIEGELKSKIGKFHLEQEARNRGAMEEAAQAPTPVAQRAAIKKIGSTAGVEGMSVSVKWEATVEDEDALPREFMMADLSKIKQHANSCSPGEEPALIPGVRFFPKATVSSRSK